MAGGPSTGSGQAAGSSLRNAKHPRGTRMRNEHTAPSAERQGQEAAGRWQQAAGSNLATGQIVEKSIGRNAKRKGHGAWRMAHTRDNGPQDHGPQTTEYSQVRGAKGKGHSAWGLALRKSTGQIVEWSIGPSADSRPQPRDTLPITSTCDPYRRRLRQSPPNLEPGGEVFKIWRHRLFRVTLPAGSSAGPGWLIGTRCSTAP
jgi:hypothetical protein